MLDPGSKVANLPGLRIILIQTNNKRGKYVFN